jgi:hypothetical protein
MLISESDSAASAPIDSTIAAQFPAAEVISPEVVPRGFNIALAGLGGPVIRAASQSKDPNWSAKNLIDGFSLIWPGDGSQLSFGWMSSGTNLPQEIVFSFHHDRLAFFERSIGSSGR